MTDEQRELAQAMIAANYEKHPPQTQKDCCSLAAGIVVALGIMPPKPSEREFKGHAAAGAEGLFGPAFFEVDDRQRQTWVNMYEDALREAVEGIA